MALLEFTLGIIAIKSAQFGYDRINILLKTLNEKCNKLWTLQSPFEYLLC